MNNRRFRFSRKNRNVISGVLVCVAAIYGLMTYFELPREELNSFFLTTLLFFLIVMLLAIAAIALIKGLVWAVRILLRGKAAADQDEDSKDSE